MRNGEFSYNPSDNPFFAPGIKHKNGMKRKGAPPMRPEIRPVNPGKGIGKTGIAGGTAAPSNLRKGRHGKTGTMNKGGKVHNPQMHTPPTAKAAQTSQPKGRRVSKQAMRGGYAVSVKRDTVNKSQIGGTHAQRTRRYGGRH